jgi:hypothetical protein
MPRAQDEDFFTRDFAGEVIRAVIERSIKNLPVAAFERCGELHMLVIGTIRHRMRGGAAATPD